MGSPIYKTRRLGRAQKRGEIWNHLWISLCQPHLDMLLFPNKRLCLPVIDGLVGSIVSQGLHLCHGNFLEERGILQSSRQNRRTQLGNSRGKSEQHRQQRFDQIELYPTRTQTSLSRREHA